MHTLCYHSALPQTGHARRQVRSVPGELSTDTNAVLRLAQATGQVAKPQLLQARIAPVEMQLLYRHLPQPSTLSSGAIWALALAVVMVSPSIIRS